MQKEKKDVALMSVYAAIFLTSFKFIVGFYTGSLGILSEALHSGLDLIAAFITFLAIRVSARPNDRNHHYGYGKIENISALIETLLLFVTCGWIIYESVHRLITGMVRIEVNIFSFIVVGMSMCIDMWRSAKLRKAAKLYKSQALEADALHFTTDIWSSAVVMTGLGFACFKFYYADIFAAIGVALIIMGVSYRLLKKSYESLMDRAPYNTTVDIENFLETHPDIRGYHGLRIRNSGHYVLVSVTIHLDPELSFRESHRVTTGIENQMHQLEEFMHIIIHQEPDDHEK